MMGLGMGAGVWQLLMAAELVREVVQLAWPPPLTLARMVTTVLGFCASGRRQRNSYCLISTDYRSDQKL